jgi:hypothetical protein
MHIQNQWPACKLTRVGTQDRTWIRVVRQRCQLKVDIRLECELLAFGFGLPGCGSYWYMNGADVVLIRVERMTGPSGVN